MKKKIKKIQKKLVVKKYKIEKEEVKMEKEKKVEKKEIIAPAVKNNDIEKSVLNSDGISIPDAIIKEE